MPFVYFTVVIKCIYVSIRTYLGDFRKYKNYFPVSQLILNLPTAATISIIVAIDTLCYVHPVLKMNGNQVNDM